jgi:acylglycerol lipase
MKPKPRSLLIASILIILSATLSACAPQLVLPGPPISEPKLTEKNIVMADGAQLPLHQWPPSGTHQKNPKAILLALHGFNDYGLFIKTGAEYFAGLGIKTYAYDQRGFGAAPHTGRWPGRNAFAQDLTTVTGLLRRRHPDTPLFVLGHSMGGAIVMSAVTGPNPPSTDGIILAAPAVWGRASMQFYQRWTLALLSHTLPWLTVTAEGLDIKPSDNIEMLRALGRDPLFIKRTRVDTIWGLVNLMDDALAAAPKLRAKTLILYGDLDQVIKKKPTKMMLAALPGLAQPATSGQRLMRYKDGYHMLLRDLQAENVWRDIAAWITGK